MKTQRRFLPASLWLILLVALPAGRVRAAAVSGCNYSYGATNQFGGGLLVNLNYTNAQAELRLNTETRPFKFLNVPCGDTGTLLRIDVTTSNVVGEYRTAPQDKASFPSHTVVDRYGNAWVANWDERGCLDYQTNGSIARIGLVIGGTRGDVEKNGMGVVTNFIANTNGQYLKPPFDYCTAVDRDGDGYIRTSLGLGDVLDWPTNAVGGVAGSVANAQDECIINYVRVPAQFVSGLALDTNDDLWVGGYCNHHTPDCEAWDVCGNRVHVKVDGVTGAVLTNRVVLQTNGVPYGGFELIVAGYGWLWSSGGANECADCPSGSGTHSLSIYDPASGVYSIATNSPLADFGMAIDPQTGNIWVTSYEQTNVAVFYPSGALYTNYYHGDTNASGLAIDNDGNVWVAHGPWFGAATVGHLHTDGTFVTNISLSTPNCSLSERAASVAIDANGKVWAVCTTTTSPGAPARLYRIDPAMEQADLCLTLSEHTALEPYGDLTGQRLLAGTAPAGVWRVVCTNGATDQPWYALSWTASTNDPSHVRVEIRAANQAAWLSTNLFQTVENGVALTNVTGQYAEIRVTLLLPAGETNSPALHDLTLFCVEEAPVIINQPTNQTACPGLSTGFSVTAAGAAPLSYQWRFNGVNLSAKTSSALSLSNVQTTNAGSYLVVVTNAYGSVTSQTATLTVWTNVGISVAPASTNVCPGASATFSVVGGGSGLSYQWYKNQSLLGGQTASSLLLTNVQTTNAGTYCVVVSGTCDAITNCAILGLNEPLTILSAPQAVSVLPGTNAVFSVEAAGTGLGYQWSKGTNVLSGRTNSTLVLTNVTATDAGSYCVAVNASCGGTNLCATLTVLCLPSPDGLVGWWQGEGNGYEAVAGKNADLYEVTFTNGVVGEAFRFDGSSAYGYVSASTNLDVGQGEGFTIECWIKPDNLYTEGPLVTWDNGWGDFGLALWINWAGSGALSVESYDTDWEWHWMSSAPGVLTAGVFQHVAFTYSKTTGLAVLYRDGQALVTTNLDSFTAQTGFELFLGGDPTWWYFYSGLMDEPGIYNRSLSADEIRAIYAAGSVGRCGIYPHFLVEPADQTTTDGNDVVFHSLAVGSFPLQYQWLTNGTPKPGEVIPNLTLLNVQTNTGGSYSVVVANSLGAITSRTATLTVNPAVCSQAPTGLISWWRAESNALDSAGLNNGFLSNGVTYAAGQVGQAFHFDAEGARVRVPASGSLNVGTGGGFTIEAWINPASVSGGHPIVEWNSGSFGAHVWLASAVSGALWFSVKDTSYRDNVLCSSGGLVTTNAFQHIVAAYDKTTGYAVLYLNGTEVAQEHLGIFTPMTTGDFYIGYRPYDGGAGMRFVGLVDEVSLYNRPLSAPEILALYNASYLGKCQEPPMITVQPTNQNVSLGSNATFTVSATGTPQLRYQWRFNGTNLTGKTQASLTLTNVQSTQAGTYTVLVTNAFGSVLSSNALLTIAGVAPEVHMISPTNNEVFILSPTNILLIATGADPGGGTIANVGFYTNGVWLGTTTNESGQFQFLWENVQPGIYSIAAWATNGAGVASDTVTNVVVNDMPLISIVDPTNSISTNLTTFTGPTNLVLHAVASDPDGTISNVQFYHRTSVSNSFVWVLLPGSVTQTNNTNFFLAWSNCPVGVQAVYSVAIDNHGASSASELLVFEVTPTNPPPSVWIIWPTNNATFPAGANITIVAEATNSALPSALVTNVEFFADIRRLGADPDRPFSLTECCWKPGKYVLRARATDSLDGKSISTPIQITVLSETPSAGDGSWDPTFTIPDTIALFHCAAAFGSTLYCGASPVGRWDSIYKWDGADWSVWDNYDLGVQTIPAIAANEDGVFYADINDNGLLIRRKNGDGIVDIGANSDLYCGVWWIPWARPVCLKIIGSDLYLGGDFGGYTWDASIEQYVFVQYLVKWNLATDTWEPVGDALDGPVFAIDSYEGDLVIGGRFDAGERNTNLHNIARLVADVWVPLGNGVAGTNSHGELSGVYSLAACGTNLFVGGDFAIAGSISNANCIARWDGNSWDRIGQGVCAMPAQEDALPDFPNPMVANLAVRGNTLFVSGKFTGIWDLASDKTGVSGIAKAVWNEDRQQWIWSDLDLGAFQANYAPRAYSGSIYSMQIVESTNATMYDVVVGGWLSFAGAGMTNLALQSANPYYQGLARWSVGKTTPTNVPFVYISFPTNYTEFTNNPSSITLDAVTVSATNIVSVDFYVDASVVGTDTTADTNFHTVQWISAAPGLHSLRAIAVDANGYRGESKAVLLSIKDPARTTIARDDSFVIQQSVPSILLPVLTNDSPASELRISSLFQPHGSLGVAAISPDKQSISFNPFPYLFGTSRFIYSITNSMGQTDSAWVTVIIQSKPIVQITSPWDGDRFRTNVSIDLVCTARDYDGVVTNISLKLNGTTFIGQTTNSTLTLSWSNGTAGFYTFVAVAADNEGLTNSSLPVTIIVTNATPSSNGPVAIISNLVEKVDLQHEFVPTVHPVIHEGLFDLEGYALDPDDDPVAYAILLFRPDDIDLAATGDLQQAIEAAQPYANLTPGVLNPQGFHDGAATNGSLGTLDFTPFPNGSYYLVLRVRGGTDETNAVVLFQLDNQLKIGQFSFTEQDLVIPVNGIPLTVTRTYNSLNPRSADVGYSWSYSLMGMDIQLDDEREDVLTFAEADEDYYSSPRTVSIRRGGGWDVTLTLPDGRRTTFVFDYDGGWPDIYAKWNAPEDAHATLTMMGDNHIVFCATGLKVPIWADSDSSGIAPFENQDIKGWILQTQDDTKYEIWRGDADNILYEREPGQFVSARAYGQPKLTSIEQRSGDKIFIEANRIYHKDTNGITTRNIWMERDRDDRIIAIRDPNAGSNGLPSVRYIYNRDTGNLIQVLKLVDRNAGTYVTNKYHYDNPNFPHYLTSMENPLGVPVARNEYDDAGRLTAIVDADGKRTEFHHSPTNHVEVVIDRLNHTNSYAYDSRGNVTAITNAMEQVTIMQYDEKNQKRAETNAFGTAMATWTLYDYDENGNQTNVVSTMNRTNSFTYDDYGNLLTHTDPLGNVTSNFYDEAGNLTNTVVRGTNDTIVEQSFSIYEDGHLKETQNANHEVTAGFYYDASGNLTNSVDANNFSRKFTYDENGNQTGSSYVWIDPNQGEHTVTTTTDYDAAGRVTQTVDANGNTNFTFYTAGGKVDYTIDKFGNTNSFLYDERGNLVQTMYPDSTVTRTVYNEDAKPYLTTDRNGITGTRTEFDALGRATNVVRLTNVVINLQPVGNGSWSSSVQNGGVPISSNLTEYYDNGWVKSRTGADGKTTSYEYWPDGQVMTVTDARTNVTYYEYDEGGRQRLVADALNHTNRFEYDAVGRMVRTIFANGSYTSNYFNEVGQRTVQVDQAELATQYGYNVSGQLTSVMKPLVPDPEDGYADHSPTWAYDYDAYGRLGVTTDPRNHSTTNFYDDLGRLVTQQLTLGKTNWNRYNDKGQLWQQWDFKRQRTEFVYDRYGRVKAKFLFAADATYPSNAVCYLFNQLGQLTNIVERSGDGVTTNVCDGYASLVGLPGTGGDGSLRSQFGVALARVPGETYGSVMCVPLLAFILALIPREKRRLLLETMREAWVVAVVQLSPVRAEVVRKRRLGRLQLPSLSWRLATAVTIVALVGSDPAYDRLWTAHAECPIPDNSSTDTERLTYFSYDLEGRLTQVNSPEGVINYGYDLATGRHTSTCTTNNEFAYYYDELGRLETVVVLKRNGAPVNETTTYTYTKVGNRETVTLPNGVKTTYHYDDLNRLTSMTHDAGTTDLASYTYELHPTGRRTNAVEVLWQGDDAYLTNTITWAYDGLYRLTGEVLLCSDPQYSYTNSYEYDLSGNRFKKTRVVVAGATTVTNAYDANDRLLREVTLVNGDCTGTNGYAYDDNGSLIEKQEIRSTGTTTVTYDYNLANKLCKVTRDGNSTSFLYNDSGIRVRSSQSGSPNPTLYLVDANNHTGYAQVLEQLTTRSGTPTRSYLIGDDVLGQSSGSSASYLLYDGHGSTRQVVDGDWGITSKYNYDAYGVAMDNCYMPNECSLQYCGEQYDTDLQMYNLRARYYDPSNGRFSQRDTFTGTNGDPQSLHKYTYAECDPENAIDPSGRYTLVETTVAIGLLLFFAATLLCVQSQLRTQASWTLNTARYQHEVAIASAGVGTVAAVRAVEDVRADIIDAIMAAGASAGDEYFLHATTYEFWPDLRKKAAKVTIDQNKFNQANDFGKGFYTWRAKDPASAASAMNSGIQSAIDWAARKMPNGMRVGVIALFRVEAATYASLDVFGPASPLSENLIGPNGMTGHDVVFGPVSPSAGPGWAYQYKFESERAIGSLQFLMAIPVVE